jgi:hypothetical protein
MIDARLMRIDIEQLLIGELQRIAVSDGGTPPETVIGDVTRILDELAAVQRNDADDGQQPLFSDATLRRLHDVLRATPTDVTAIKGSLHVMLLLAGIQVPPVEIEVELSTPPTTPVRVRRVVYTTREPHAQEAVHRDAKAVWH